MNRTGLRGAFTKLMKEHPDVAKHLIALNQNLPLCLPLRHIHKEMLIALRQKGVDCLEYPFNTQSLGYYALSRYLKAVTQSEKTQNLQDVTPVVSLHSGTQYERLILYDRNRGRPPAIYFESLRYIGNNLPQQTAKVILAINVEDIRVISAYRIDGSFIGNLTNPTLSRLDSPYSLNKHRQRTRNSSHHKGGGTYDCAR